MTTYLKSTATNLYKKLLNTIDGPGFNRNAHEESRNSSKKYHQHVSSSSSDKKNKNSSNSSGSAHLDAGSESDSDSDSKTGWEHIEMRSRLREESSEGDFMIEDEPGVVQKMIAKFSSQALSHAGEAAGESKEYILFASKYILKEMARDMGWLMNCPTATDAMRAVRQRFPLTEDLQRAYEQGARGIASEEGPLLTADLMGGITIGGNRMRRTQEPVDGVTDPRDVVGVVESNLDGLAIWGMEGVRGDFAYRDGRVLGEEERGRKRERD